VGVFEGLLGGFQSRQAEVRQQEQEEANASADRESKVYQALINSPDPEIAAMATSGLLESAGPRKRKSGLSGWLGEMSKSPTYQRLQELIKSPVQTDPGSPATLPHTNYPMIATPPPSLGEGPAGTPTHSLTEPGAPAAPNLPTPGPPEQIPGQVAKPPTFGPRHVFATPEETYAAQARGKAEGDVEGDIAGYVAAGMSRPDAVAQVRGERLKARGAESQSIAGEVTDPKTGQTHPEFGIFDRGRQGYIYPEGHPHAGQPIPNFNPRTTTGSTSMGADREAVARELFGLPYVQLNQTQQGTVNTTAITRAGQKAEATGLGTGRAQIATKLATPIGPTAARQYNVNPTTTLGELHNTIGLTDVQKQRIYAVGQLDTMIKDIETGLPKVFPNVQPGIGGAITTALSLGIQKLSADDDLAGLDAAINGALAQVAQMTGQPGSRLSDKDLELAKSLLANLKPTLFGGDTLATAQARLNVLKELMNKAQESIPTTPQIGAPPPAGGKPQAAAPRTITPPPSGATAGGPAGWFVENGKLVQH
jgi:hypothetical protein